MKNLIILCSLIFIVSYTNAQTVKEVEVPTVIKEAFKQLHPDITKVKWEKEDANYEAEIEVNDVETSLLFDANGNLKETETEVEVSALPQSIQKYVETNLENKKIKEASKIVDNQGTVMYEAEVDKIDYIFDANGNLLSKDNDKGQIDTED